MLDSPLYHSTCCPSLRRVSWGTRLASWWLRRGKKDFFRLPQVAVGWQKACSLPGSETFPTAMAAPSLRPQECAKSYRGPGKGLSGSGSASGSTQGPSLFLLPLRNWDTRAAKAAAQVGAGGCCGISAVSWGCEGLALVLFCQWLDSDYGTYSLPSRWWRCIHT